MEPVRRVCAKVLLVDPHDRALLFSGIDRLVLDDPPVWFPVGGGADEGETLEQASVRETLEQAAVRETLEEAGLRILDPGRPVFTRRVRWIFEGLPYDQEETYFVVRVSSVSPDESGWTDVEKATIRRTPVVDHRRASAHHGRSSSPRTSPTGSLLSSDLCKR